MGRLTTLELPNKFNPRRVSPGNLKAWYDSTLPGNGGVALADASSVVVWEDRANPGRAFYDTFASLDSGWTNVQGTIAVSGGKGSFSSDTNLDLAVRETGLANGIFSWVINGDLDTTGSNFSIPQVVFRYVDSNNYLLVSTADGAVRLSKRDGGVETSLSLSGATTTTDNTNYELRAICNGNSVEIKKDGTSLFTYTLAGGDTKYAAYTMAGMRLRKTGTPSYNATWDNFIVCKLTDALQTTAANQPVYKTAIQNGKAVVRFDGSNDYLISLFASTLTQPNTICLVVKFSSGGSGQFVIDGIGGSNRNAFYYAATPNVRINAGGDFAYPSAYSTGVFDQFTAVFNGTSSVLARNGSATTGNPSTNSLTGLTIGSRLDFVSPLNGDIAEILVYNAALTTAQRRRVEKYLAKRWGVSLTRQVIEDTFTRPDSALTLGSAETGQAWTALNGTWGITSNTAYLVAANGNYNFAVVESGVSDCAVQDTFSTFGANQYIVFRASDQNNLIVVEGQTTTAYNLYKRVASTWTQIGTWATTPANGDVIRVTLSGTSITVYVNGTSRITATEAANQTNTMHGIGIYNSTSARWDNFTVEV